MRLSISEKVFDLAAAPVCYGAAFWLASRIGCNNNKAILLSGVVGGALISFGRDALASRNFAQIVSLSVSSVLGTLSAASDPLDPAHWGRLVLAMSCSSVAGSVLGKIGAPLAAYFAHDLVKQEIFF